MMSALAARLSQSAFIADLTTRERSLWRVTVTVLVAIVAGIPIALIVGVIASVVFGAVSGLFQGDLRTIARHVTALLDPNHVSLTSSLGIMFLVVATNGALALTLVGVAALLTGRRLKNYVSVAPRIRWRLLACGLILSALAIAPTVLVSEALDPHPPVPPLLSMAADWPTRLGYALACIALLVPAAAAEELVFRGWLLRETAAISRAPWVLMAVNGVLFSAVHGQFEPSAFLLRALMGAGFVYMTLRLGGIEFSTGAHAANNIIIVLFIQPLTTALPPPQPMTWADPLQDGYLLVSYVVLTEVVMRWAPLRRWTGAGLGEHPPAGVAQTFA
jgi:membrane protease YdiL (CAAX protease family)